MSFFWRKISVLKEFNDSDVIRTTKLRDRGAKRSDEQVGAWKRDSR